MKTKDIQTVYRRGVKAYHPLFRLLVLPTTQSTSRYAVVVSTKVSKRAVDRNRIKRQVRPILRQTLHNIKPHDLVVIAQTQANRADTKTITAALQQLFKKAHLLWSTMYATQYYGWYGFTKKHYHPITVGLPD